jgi:hypothetical protein
MPFITMDATHAIGRDEALKRLKDKFAVAKARYGGEIRNLEEQWTDHTLNFSFSAMGMGVSGTLKVEDDSVKLNAEIPFAATFFKGAIERRLSEELDRLLT